MKVTETETQYVKGEHGETLGYFYYDTLAGAYVAVRADGHRATARYAVQARQLHRER